MFAQQLFSEDLIGSSLEVITSMKKTYLYVSICTFSYRFVVFYILTYVNVKNKCTCVDVERFKDMFANSKRLSAYLRSLLLHADQAFIVSDLSAFYFPAFYFAMLIARKQKY